MIVLPPRCHRSEPRPRDGSADCDEHGRPAPHRQQRQCRSGTGPGRPARALRMPLLGLLLLLLLPLIRSPGASDVSIALPPPLSQFN